MARNLLLLNSVFFLFATYTIAISWSIIELVPILLFGTSMALLLRHKSRIGNQILVWANGFFTAVGILLVAVGTVGGLFNYGPGALAVLVLLLPIAVLAANCWHGKKMLALAS